MMNFEVSLPPQIYLVDGTSMGYFRPGLVNGPKTLQGRVQKRDYSETGLRTLRAKLNDMRGSADGMHQAECFMIQSRGMTRPVWVRIPFKRNIRELLCGAKGNGSNRFFALPIADVDADSLEVYSGVERLSSSDYELAPLANVIRSAQASPESMASIDETEGFDADISRCASISVVGGFSYKITPTGQASGLRSKTDGKYLNPVEASTEHRLCCCFASATGQQIVLQLDWYTAAYVFISSDTLSTPVTSIGYEWQSAYLDATSPSNAAFARWRIYRVSSPDLNPLFFDTIGILPLSHDRWIHPNSAFGMLKLDTAPAENVRVIAGGYGYPNLPMDIASQSFEASLYDKGTAIPKILEMIEFPEE